MYVISDVKSVVCVILIFVKLVADKNTSIFHIYCKRSLEFSRCTSTVTLRALFALFRLSSGLSLTKHIYLSHLLQEKSEVLKMYVNSDVESVVYVISSFVRLVADKNISIFRIYCKKTLTRIFRIYVADCKKTLSRILLYVNLCDKKIFDIIFSIFVKLVFDETHLSCIYRKTISDGNSPHMRRCDEKTVGFVVSTFDKFVFDDAHQSVEFTATKS
jgi:hypothetical protein